MSDTLENNPEIERVLTTAFMHLVQTAANDGVITEDEFAILDAAEEGLKQYKRVLIHAMKDGVIDEIESAQLEKVKEMIINTTRIIADIDDILSTDELNMIMAIIVKLNEPKIKKLSK